MRTSGWFRLGWAGMLLLGCSHDPLQAGAVPGAPKTVCRAEASPKAARFLEWLGKYQAAHPRARSAELIGEGARLARERRAEMAELIQIDPRAAVEAAMGGRWRGELPGVISALFEEEICGRGDLEVLGVWPEPGMEGKVPARLRTARIGGREFRAFVYGWLEDEPTRRNVYLEGVAVNGLLAVKANEGADETAELAGVGAAEEYAASTYTLGLKRLLLMRVDFEDLEGEPFSDMAGADLVEEMHEFYDESSYGRAGFRLVGSGSAVTPVFRMPQTALYYGGDNRYAELRQHAREAAAAAGYVLEDYDFDVVCMGRVPGFGWLGLGYVGSAGAWLRNTASSGLAAHELGHNFGLNHANFWDTGGASIIGTGTSVEYGDSFDTMGTAGPGRRHFNTRYKRLLNWIKDDEVAAVTESGVYRIFAQDDRATQGLRALSIAKDETRNYWVEFRQQFTDNRWMMAGASLRWAGNGRQRSDLLDTTPGSAGGQDDSAIVIGRTFSDQAAGICVTPIGKAGTVPEALDVLVHLGASPGNGAPLVAVGAERTEVPAAEVVRFQALADDPDGDVLAYYWDFGDGEFGTNGPAAGHSWAEPGEYVVRCEVSDMKGGRGSDSVIVRVGTPSAFRISGRVGAAGVPLEGVRVYVSPTVMTYTDSDGSYTLAGLGAGSYTVQTSHEAYSFGPAGFTNPVRVGPSARGIDFLGGEAVSAGLVALIPQGAEWRFLDDGSDQGTAWRRLDFADTSWRRGNAQLGYGDGDEATILDFGSDPGEKFITTYFRRCFLVEDPGDFSVLDLGLVRDDGAVVYLNGQEVFRSNMPSGPVDHTTLAAGTVSGSDEDIFFGAALGTDALVRGTNLLAVEIHQAGPTSSDISFDLRLTGVVTSNTWVGSGGFWRYLDDGSDQGTAWVAPDFDDGTWEIGPAELGYGDGDEETEVSYGGDANNKHITTYFRRAFFDPGDSRVGLLTLGVLRDDGVVVYLNGEEVLRSNMPEEEIDSTTRALSAVSGADESEFIKVRLDPARLRVGRNVLAAEVHQVLPSSTDISFDAFLASLCVLNQARGLYLSSPAHLSQIPFSGKLVVAAEVAVGYGRQVRQVDFFRGTECLQTLREAPYRFTWSNPPFGRHQLLAVATDDQGETLSSLPVEITVVAPPVEVALVSAGSDWKYLDDGSDQGAAWVSREFDDSAWASGAARLGYGGDGEVTRVGYGPSSGNKHVTTYFRRWFELSDPAWITNLAARLQRDDGALVWLNGAELFRNNLPQGPVGYNTLAEATVAGADEQAFYEFSLLPAFLVEGRNLLAVEVHQVSRTSSDLGFDLELIGRGTAPGAPPLRWEWTRSGLVLAWPLEPEGWVLHSAPAVPSKSGWWPVLVPKTQAGGENQVLIQPASERQFFRLLQP